MVNRWARGSLAVLLVLSTVLGPHATAQAAPAADDLVGFDRKFREGQEQYNHARYLDAARTWTAAADLLSETAANRDNRQAVFDYIAESYRHTLVNGAGQSVLREGLAVLDAYAAGYAAAYPGEALGAQIDDVRNQLRAAVEAAEPKPADPPPEPDKPAEPTPVVSAGTRPPDAPPAPAWKGLAIGGGVVLGGGVASLGLFIGGLVRAREAERNYEDPANMCPPSDPTGACAGFDRTGRSMNTLATVGLVAAPVLLGVGAAMLAIGLKRRAKAQAMVPVVGPRMVGLVWEQRF
jgi:hypothetical protein